MSVRRGIGYTIGRTIAHSLVNEGKRAMRQITDRRWQDAQDAQFEPVGQRWYKKHSQYGQADYSRSVNQPIRPPSVVYVNKTPIHKIIFWIAVGVAAMMYFGTDYFVKEPSNVIGYHYMPNGKKLCYYRSFPPSEWDAFPSLCPGKSI